MFGSGCPTCARQGIGERGRDRGRWDEGARQRRRDANLEYEQIARAILEKAKAVDAAEDEPGQHERPPCPAAAPPDEHR